MTNKWIINIAVIIGVLYFYICALLALSEAPSNGGFFYLTIYQIDALLLPLIVLLLPYMILSEIKKHDKNKEIGTIIYLGICCIVALRNTFVKAYEWYASSSPERFADAVYEKNGLYYTPWGVHLAQTVRDINQMIYDAPIFFGLHLFCAVLFLIAIKKISKEESELNYG